VICLLFWNGELNWKNFEKKKKSVFWSFYLFIVHLFETWVESLQNEERKK